MSFITTLLEKKAAGEALGLLVSKTQYGVSAAAITGLWEVLPDALGDDHAAIGQALLIVGGWVTALYGRLKA